MGVLEWAAVKGTSALWRSLESVPPTAAYRIELEAALAGPTGERSIVGFSG